MKYIKLIGGILIAIGGFFIFMGFKVENYNLYLLIGGGFIALIGWIPISFINKKEENTVTELHRRWKEKLLKDGLKIEVDLNKAEIKSNNYQQEIEEPFTRLEKYKALDTLTGKDTREFKQINECVVIYETEVLGKTKKITVLSFLKTKLHFNFYYLIRKKQLSIWINRMKTIIYLISNSCINNTLIFVGVLHQQIP